MSAQESNTQSANQAQTKDIDPLALDVLRAVAEPVEKAKAFSFKAVVGEEQLADNGQVITLFHTVDVTVQRPDKVHLVFKRRGQRVDFYGVAGKITMYSPDQKFYTSIAAKDTIDANATEIYQKGFDMPIGPFLRDDFYDVVAKGVNSAYVIGRSKIDLQEVHQLAFTGEDADCQLWVTGGENPQYVRAEIVNKKLEGKPRTTIQFLDWNLSPTIQPDEFTFNKPADAVEIGLMNTTEGK